MNIDYDVQISRIEESEEKVRVAKLNLRKAEKELDEILDFVELDSARAKSNDKIYKDSETGETFETADDFANAVCYRNKYPENYNENGNSIRIAVIDRFQRH